MKWTKSGPCQDGQGPESWKMKWTKWKSTGPHAVRQGHRFAMRPCLDFVHFIPHGKGGLMSLLNISRAV